MTCLIHEGGEACVWCRQPKQKHPFRWCRICKGDMTVPDPTDRESQLQGRPAWQWRQTPCGCRHGIVTIEGQPLTEQQRAIIRNACEPAQPLPFPA